jgi:hypothetical protein
MTFLTIGGFILISVFMVLIIPWYLKQLGRFFCNGILEYLKEQTQEQTKGERNGEKEQSETRGINGIWKQGCPERKETGKEMADCS